MKRRTFLQYLSGSVLWASTLPLQSSSSRPLRFGVVTDLHYAEREKRHTRYYQQSCSKLRDAMDDFIAQKLDFVVELGDFKDMYPDNDAEAALRYLDTIEAELQRFGGKVYHVLGNHDMDCISKEEFLSHTSNPGKARGQSYYTFTARGVQFIVLDANFNKDRSPYCRGNFKWQEAYIPQEELDWLHKELQRGKKPVVVLSHQLLDSFSDAPKSVCIGNADEVVRMLEESGRVLAVLQGHHHSGHYSLRNGIHYWTMKAMIENEYPAHNSYAIVTIDRSGGILIEGYADCESRNLKE